MPCDFHWSVLEGTRGKKPFLHNLIATVQWLRNIDSYFDNREGVSTNRNMAGASHPARFFLYIFIATLDDTQSINPEAPKA